MEVERGHRAVGAIERRAGTSAGGEQGTDNATKISGWAKAVGGFAARDSAKSRGPSAPRSLWRRLQPLGMANLAML